MRIFGRVFVSLLLIGAIGALGYGVWNAGYQQGLVETVGATAEVVVTAPYYPGYYGFGVFGLMFKIFFAFILFGLLFKVLFGRRHWRHYGTDRPDHYRSTMESRMTKWHEEAHRGDPGTEPDTS